MDLSLYLELTGKTISESEYTRYSAVIARVGAQLESILGWSFTPEVLFVEEGKTQKECVCPDIPSSLDDPDEVYGIIKVFPYNWKDKFLHVDPFKNVYNVKLVKVLENGSFVTYKTFDSYTAQYMSKGIGKYIERCATCYCDCDCKDCVQLAVDADWLSYTGESGEDELPDELLYLWCDMVDYYADPYKDIKSESVDGHSWSKGDVKAPETLDANLRILSKYAGPFGTIARIATV